MAVNEQECSIRLVKRFVDKYLLADKWKPYEVYSRMCYEYEEAYF